MLELPITGMTCANCAATIERVLKRQNGILEANVNFANEKAYIKIVPGIADKKAIRESIGKAGYQVADSGDIDDGSADTVDLSRKKEIRQQTQIFWTGVAFTIPLFYSAC